MEINFQQIVSKAFNAFKSSGKTFQPPQPIDKRQPGAVLLFQSRQHQENWLFMASTKTPTQTWRDAFYKLHQKPSPQVPFPDTLILNKTTSGKEYLNDQQILDHHADTPQTCKLCHGLEVAYVLRNPLILNDIPQKVRAVPCWCSKHKKITTSGNEPF